ncbi:IS3 family transposase [Actinokineospora sp.]|uniref:IS3 family transposase n=1 Tax=Actinokineospora sp. TaxID=1872133 RepID=UPI003D6AACA0
MPYPTGCWARRSSGCTRTTTAYGARKVWAELIRDGIEVARRTVERLMRENGPRGLPRDKSPAHDTPGAGDRKAH